MQVATTTVDYWWAGFYGRDTILLLVAPTDPTFLDKVRVALADRLIREGVVAATEERPFADPTRGHLITVGVDDPLVSFALEDYAEIRAAWLDA